MIINSSLIYEYILWKGYFEQEDPRVTSQVQVFFQDGSELGHTAYTHARPTSMAHTIFTKCTDHCRYSSKKDKIQGFLIIVRDILGRQIDSFFIHKDGISIEPCVQEEVF